MNLAQAAANSGRRNNFNLVRLFAALCVLLSHSFTLATGDARREPFTESLGISLGSLAVVVFFITSGFLVGGSILSRGQAARFVASRLTRIYPALIVLVALTVFVAGPAMTSLPIADYFTSSDTWKYLFLNSTAFFGIEFYLPGVFTHNPYLSSVNGALWTLRFELLMYVILLVTWFVTVRRGKTKLFAVIVTGLVIAGSIHYWQRPELMPDVASRLGKLGWLTPMFFIGVGAHLLRSFIPLRAWIAATSLVLLIGAAIAGHAYFKAAYPLCLSYLVLFIVYSTPAVEWAQHRDYSYGLYIFGFLIQQTTAYFLPGIQPLSLMAVSLVATATFAIASWHLVEKPALARVDDLTALLQTTIRRLTSRRAIAA